MPPQGRLGDQSHCPADAHGCPGCAHPVVGPAISGSPNVFVNGRPALRVDDVGIHAACCGPNTWQATEGAPYVLINDRKAHRLGDADRHCGGQGKLIEGSDNVIVGNAGSGGSGGGGGGDGGGAGGGGGGGAGLKAASRAPTAGAARSVEGSHPNRPKTLQDAIKMAPGALKDVKKQIDDLRKFKIGPADVEIGAGTVDVNFDTPVGDFGVHGSKDGVHGGYSGTADGIPLEAGAGWDKNSGFQWDARLGDERGGVSAKGDGSGYVAAGADIPLGSREDGAPVLSVGGDSNGNVAMEYSEERKDGKREGVRAGGNVNDGSFAAEAYSGDAVVGGSGNTDGDWEVFGGVGQALGSVGREGDNHAVRLGGYDVQEVDDWLDGERDRPTSKPPNRPIDPTPSGPVTGRDPHAAE